MQELEQLRPLANKAAINVEKIHTLDTQLSLMEDLRKRGTEMEIEVTLLRKEKEAWNTFLETNEPSQSPEEISRDLHRERAARKTDQERLQTYETELIDSRTRLRTLEQSVDTLTSELQSKQDHLTKTERRYERLERQKNLAQREVQFLKEQLKTYDSEETVFFNSANVDTHKLARITGLEKLVQEYKSELDRIKTEPPLSPTPTAENAKRKRNDLSHEQDEELRRKIRVLQNGSPPQHAPSPNDRSDQISPSRNITAKRRRITEITSRVPGKSSQIISNKSSRVER